MLLRGTLTGAGAGAGLVIVFFVIIQVTFGQRPGGQENSILLPFALAIATILGCISGFIGAGAGICVGTIVRQLTTRLSCSAIGVGGSAFVGVAASVVLGLTALVGIPDWWFLVIGTGSGLLAAAILTPTWIQGLTRPAVA
jgi:hypothetical protein